MDVYNDSLAKFRNLMKEKGHQKVVEEFSEFKDNSGVFMPDIITATRHHSSPANTDTSSGSSNNSFDSDGGGL